MSVHKLPTAEEVTASVQTLTPAQKIIMDRVVKAVVDGTPTVFYLEAPGAQLFIYLLF